MDTSSNLTRTPSLSLSFIVVTLLLTRNERTKQRSPLLSSIRTMPNNAEVLLLKWITSHANPVSPAKKKAANFRLSISRTILANLSITCVIPSIAITFRSCSFRLRSDSHFLLYHPLYFLFYLLRSSSSLLVAILIVWERRELFQFDDFGAEILGSKWIVITIDVEKYCILFKKGTSTENLHRRTILSSRWHPIF